MRQTYPKLRTIVSYECMATKSPIGAADWGSALAIWLQVAHQPIFLVQGNLKMEGAASFPETMASHTATSNLTWPFDVRL